MQRDLIIFPDILGSRNIALLYPGFAAVLYSAAVIRTSERPYSTSPNFYFHIPTVAKTKYSERSIKTEKL